MASAGTLAKSNLVWKQGMENWVQAGMVQELQTVFGSVPPIQEFLIIIEFTHFASFYNFHTKGDDFRNKEVVQVVKVRVGI